MATVSDRSHISTEKSNPASDMLDNMGIEDAVALMNDEDLKMVQAVGEQKRAIAQAVRMVTQTFKTGGRLIYIGAGTSGRLGVLDASECPPTFCNDPSMVIGIIAGGDTALRKSIENAEDQPSVGAEKMMELHISAKDVVMGIAAGGTTPFVHGALNTAKTRGAKTIFLICTKPEHVQGVTPDLFIAVEPGPEILTGSTRLKAGTATKLVLNMITTLSMVQIGKTYGNLMVDVDTTKNAKLIDRGLRIITKLTGLDRDSAYTLLQKAEGKVKRAIVMHKKNVPPAEADRLLETNAGRLRTVIG